MIPRAKGISVGFCRNGFVITMLGTQTVVWDREYRLTAISSPRLCIDVDGRNFYQQPCHLNKIGAHGGVERKWGQSLEGHLH